MKSKAQSQIKKQIQNLLDWILTLETIIRSKSSYITNLQKKNKELSNRLFMYDKLFSLGTFGNVEYSKYGDIDGLPIWTVYWPQARMKIDFKNMYIEIQQQDKVKADPRINIVEIFGNVNPEMVLFTHKMIMDEEYCRKWKNTFTWSR